MRLVLNKEQYRRYLKSPYWQRVRLAVKRKRGWSCEYPGCLGRRLHVHHLTYDHLGFEMDHLDDVQILCAYHHKRVHGRLWWQKLSSLFR